MYRIHERPDLFRDTLPAWNDGNLLSLSEQIYSRMFFAHVGVSTETRTSRENCHPFRHASSLFMHNGRIGGYLDIRREIKQIIPTKYYNERRGTADSEAFFLLALSHGLRSDRSKAIAHAIKDIEKIMQNNKIDDPFRMTAAYTNGRQLVSVRYSSDDQSPSPFWTTGSELDFIRGRVGMKKGSGAALILSELLDADTLTWREVPENHVLITDGEKIFISKFSPQN